MNIVGFKVSGVGFLGLSGSGSLQQCRPLMNTSLWETRNNEDNKADEVSALKESRCIHQGSTLHISLVADPFFRIPAEIDGVFLFCRDSSRLRVVSRSALLD